MGWGEATDLVDELLRHTDSHLRADLAGWDAVTDDAGLYGQLLFESVHNALLPAKEKPLVLPKPWSTPKAQEVVTEAERSALKEQLLRRSAFRDR